MFYERNTDNRYAKINLSNVNLARGVIVKTEENVNKIKLIKYANFKYSFKEKSNGDTNTSNYERDYKRDNIDTLVLPKPGYNELLQVDATLIIKTKG